jgi:hypothetical protein
MSEEETQAAASLPERPWFQFTLRTLFLVFVMLASSLAVFGAWGIGVFVFLVALAILVHRFPPSIFLVALSAAAICVVLFFVWTLSGISDVNEAAHRAACSNNVVHIAHALQQYHRANGCFPPAYIVDKSGKPIHSWRLLLLPYLEYGDLYKKYSLTEPWNGPNNGGFSAARLPAFVCIGDRKGLWSSTPLTDYLGVIGQNAAWLGDKPRKLADFGGKAADTIMVVEAADSGIAWAEPKDLSLDGLSAKNAKLAPMPGSNHGPQSDYFFVYDDPNGAYAAMADGSVRYLPPSSLTPERLHALLQIGGCTEGKLTSLASSYRFAGLPNWPNIAALAVWLISVAALLTRAVRSRPKTIAGTPIITN